jgi:protocatechuate 3,4-dioxygenase beta subunit
MISYSKRKLLGWIGGAAVLSASAVIFRKPLMRTALSLVVDNSRYAKKKSAPLLDSKACVVTSSSIEGPFYVAFSPLRSDIRENEIGQALRLRLKLVDSESCLPIRGVEVHVWHANAHGRYSGYEHHSPDEVELTSGHLPVETNQRFLRGHQLSNDQGEVEFLTIMPAWYSFRTPHIHVKALLPNNHSITTQLYFPETLNTKMRETIVPYSARVSPLVNNRSDPVIHSSKGAPGGGLR